jgi:hypothetical protein
MSFDPFTFSIGVSSSDVSSKQRSLSGRSSFSKPSPRQTTYKLKKTQPPTPIHHIDKALADKAYGDNLEYKMILESTKTLSPRVDDSNLRSTREMMQELFNWTDEQLKALYYDEKTGNTDTISSSSSVFLYQQQISVLNESMKKFCKISRNYSFDYSNLAWKLWSSANDLYSTTMESLSATINDLTLKLSEKSFSSAKWEEKYHNILLKCQLLEKKNLLKENELAKRIRELEEEIIFKDKAIYHMQVTIANATLWFPNFLSFGHSVLSKFLSPVSMEQIENNKMQIFASNTADQEMKLAKEYLLEDLKRIEELSLGFKIVSPAHHHTTSSSAASISSDNIIPFASPVKQPPSQKSPNKSLQKAASVRERSYSTKIGSNTPSKTDVFEAGEIIANLTKQVELSHQRQPANRLDTGLSAQRSFKGSSFSISENEANDEIIEDLQQKLEAVMNEIQVLESENQLLQVSAKGQIMNLENELRHANDHEKQLILQLQKTRNESESLLACLPSAFYLPKIDFPLIPEIAANGKGRFLYDIEGIVRLENDALIDLLSIEELEKVTFDFFDSFTSPVASSSSLNDSPLCLEGDKWNYHLLTNILNGQGKNLFSLPSMPFEVMVEKFDPVHDNYENHESDITKIKKAVKSVYLFLLFSSWISKYQNYKKAVSDVDLYVSSFLFYYASYHKQEEIKNKKKFSTSSPTRRKDVDFDEDDDLSNTNHRSIILLIGKLLFGPAFNSFHFLEDVMLNSVEQKGKTGNENALTVSKGKMRKTEGCSDYKQSQYIDIFCRIYLSMEVNNFLFLYGCF